MNGRFRSISWIVVATAMLSAPAAQAGRNECPSTQQRLDGVCVDQQIVNFVTCIERTSKGQIRTSTYEKNLADRGNTVNAGLGLQLIRVGGQAHVTVDDRNVGEVMKLVEATFGEEVVRSCRELSRPSSGTATRHPFIKASTREAKQQAPTALPSPSGVCKEDEIKALARRAGLFHPPKPNAHLVMQDGDVSYWRQKRLPCAVIAKEFEARRKALENASQTGHQYRTQGDLSADVDRIQAGNEPG